MTDEEMVYYLEHADVTVGQKCKTKTAEAIEKALKIIKSQPKNGHWIRITNGAMREKYICSECGKQIEEDGIEGLIAIKYPYCHCGAKMVESEESCINYEDGCEEWAGCPCVYYKGRK